MFPVTRSPKKPLITTMEAVDLQRLRRRRRKIVSGMRDICGGVADGSVLGPNATHLLL